MFSDITDEEIEKQTKDIVDSQDVIIKTVESAAQKVGLTEESLKELKFLLEERIYHLRSYLIELKKRKEQKKDKGVYESAVTNRYFEDWDSLELEGNPGIKDQIKANLVEAEKRNEQHYRRMAQDLGISTEELKKQLQKKVEEMTRRAEFFRATQINIFDKVFNVDERWKSQFETGTSNGNLNPNYRAQQEINMFGFNKTEISGVVTNPDDYYFGSSALPKEVLEKDKERRPIYGYFSDEEHGAINSVGRIPPPTNVTQYGTINIKIRKDRALKKATITFHDSLGPGRNWPPSPAAKPHFTSLRIEDLGSYSLQELKNPSITNWGSSYTEVQYHGQLTVEDAELIYISPNNSEYYDREITSQDMERVRQIFGRYKAKHPKSNIKLIEF